LSSGLHRQFALDEIKDLGYFQSVDWVDSIDSTNKRLSQLVRENSTRLPALLATDEQTTGVGRGSNQWWSPAGCLMFSMAIPIGISEQAACVSSDLLPLRTGCTVAECLDSFSATKPLVKWPNDVYIAGKKVCGILIEVIPKTTDRTAIAIIGIGINCRVEFRDAPTDIRVNATSLHINAKKELVESVGTETVLVAFIHRWLEIQQRQLEDPKWLIKSWPKRSLLDGHWIEVKHSNGLTQGRCMGINESGAILVQNEQLEVVEVLAGTIQSFHVA
jgi:BirA family transcriptional regulator, biotin operon repressor / biotin---[acetyl-CoA-carboxylase] ligase